MLESLLWLLLGLIFLAFGGDLLVRGAVRLALLTGLSTAVAGFTIVALGTSAPEFIVSFTAAIQQRADIAVANVVGSNIFNVAAILGLCALIRPLVVHKTNLRLEWPFLLIISIGCGLFFWDGIIGPLEGTLFLLTLLLFMTFRIYVARKEGREEKIKEISEKTPGTRSRELLGGAFWTVFGSVLLVLGARWMIDGATDLARVFGISERVIGLTIVAAGTGLPELAASVMASARKHDDVAIGNVLGSNLLNLLWVLGAASLVHPLAMAEKIARVDTWWMIGVTFLLLPLMFYKSRISRFSGVILLTTYLGYLYFLF